MKKIKLFITLLFFSTLLSCVTTDSGVELFINKEKSVKYFFPSLKWDTDIKNITLKADWLYRDYALEDEKKPRTILNFTLSSRNLLFRERPDHILLSANNIEILIPSNHIRLIYIDKGRTRYSTWIPSLKMDELMRNAEDNISMSFKLKSDYRFRSPRGFKLHIEYFKQVLLGIDLTE